MAQKKERNYAAIKRDVAAYDDEQVIGAVELAALLATTDNMIYRYNYIKPTALPPRLSRFGRKLCWRMGTCREWLRNQASPEAAPSPQQSATRRTGHPRAADKPAEPKKK